MVRGPGAFLLGAVAVVRCGAQITGDIEVLVMDRSGAGIARASVVARSLETGVSRESTCDDTGAVRIRQLPAARYQVTARAPGFEDVTNDAAVTTGALTALIITLRIEATREAIVVSDVASPLQAAGAQLQTATEAAKVAGSPVGTVRGPLAIGGGSILSLAALSPGVTAEMPRGLGGNPGTFSANGNRGRANNITLDSATVTDVVTSGAMGLQTVPIDAVKEFTLITTNFNAEYGRNSGAQVQVLTKSGTNEFHGSLFEFFRSSAFNARDYFDRTGRATPLNSHDWGTAVGGPVRRNRVFLFGHYQQIITRGSSGTVLAKVPTPEQVAGPIDPTSAQLLRQLRVPVASGGTVTNPSPQTADFHGFSTRVDVNLSARDFFFARYGYADYLFRSPTTTFPGGATLPTRGSAVANRPQNATAAWTHTFSPALVNQFLAAFGRSIPTFPPLYDLSGPSINFSDGTAAFGWNPSLINLRLQNTFQYMDTLTWNHGAHAWKFGADLNRMQSNTYNDMNVRGTFTFLTLADFLAGRPEMYSQRFGNPYRGMRSWNPAFYAQNDYRPARYLSISFGLRLEIAGRVTEVNGLNSNLNLDRRDPIGAAGSGVLGSFDVGGPAVPTNWNWAPRLGFAWNPAGGRTTIRGGYGVTYDFLSLVTSSTQLRFLPPLMYQYNLTRETIMGADSYARLVAGDSGFQLTGRATAGGFPASIRNLGGFTAVDQSLRNPQVHTWSLTLERGLPWGFAGRVSYIGTKSNYLQRTRPINLLPPGRLPLPRSLEEETTLLPVFRALNNGLNPSATGASNRVDPRFAAVSLIDSSANSNYHSTQLYIARRFASGYSLAAAYTFSKSIDDASDSGNLPNDSSAQQNPFDNRNNRAISAFDVPHRFAIVHRFDTPWFAGTQTRALRMLAHGWLFEGVFQTQSGLPVTLLAGPRLGLTDPLLLGGNGGGRPNVIGPVDLHFDADPGGGSSNPNKVTGSGLEQPMVGYFGNLGRNTMRVNPMIQVDWVVGKVFALREGTRLELRFQIYNVFNNTTFSNLGRTLAAPATLGYYQNTDSDSRNLQIVARIIW